MAKVVSVEALISAESTSTELLWKNMYQEGKLFEDCVLQADQGCDFDFLLREGNADAKS
jgi:hypothetical protein